MARPVAEELIAEHRFTARFHRYEFQDRIGVLIGNAQELAARIVHEHLHMARGRRLSRRR